MLADFLGEAIAEGILDAVSKAIRCVVGFTYLYLRYWTPQRVRQVLARQYDSKYFVAGSAVLTWLVQGLIILLLLALWIGVPLSAWLHK
ncbi:hypothetical protein [Hymenobacter wooponensis]|uniref:hypothetical protein n=1 Tax=Hymenobacter wooponensis TaxID=1525360 RepID=UPI001AEC4899|nr:hypothetical protein [Hymenobacter wooponensis]